MQRRDPMSGLTTTHFDAGARMFSIMMEGWSKMAEATAEFNARWLSENAFNLRQMTQGEGVRGATAQWPALTQTHAEHLLETWQRIWTIGANVQTELCRVLDGQMANVSGQGPVASRETAAPDLPTMPAPAKPAARRARQAT